MKLLTLIVLLCPLMLRAASAEDDLGLVDWARQPFSDHASHGVLRRQGEGLLAWQLRSATAFGGLAAGPHAAKELLSLNLRVWVQGEAAPRFAQGRAPLQSYPHWVAETLEDGPLSAEAVTLFPAQDVALAVVVVKNTGKQVLQLRPQLLLRRSPQALKGSAELSARYPAWWLELDRSAQVGRPWSEQLGVWMGGASKCLGSLADVEVKPREPQSLAGQAGISMDLSWAQAVALGPGQSLRIPILLGWGPERDELQKRCIAQWNAAALPAGLAWKTAKARWAETRKRLPPVEEPRARAFRRAVLDLKLSEYAPRGAMHASQFSAQKGTRDAFFSLDSPLAALGWSELDRAKAQAALLDLASFSAALPAPLPPHTGEDKLQWEAAGLPLHGLVGWALYHRDPQAVRAGQFLGKLGKALRSEAAWWPPARDGDGNGLYAFARPEEQPPYLQRHLPVLGQGPVLTTWSLALSSLVAWQFQAAAALAAADQSSQEAQELIALAQKTQAALLAQSWDQGLDRLWPLVLGLVPDETMVQTQLAQAIQWTENGVMEPWRAYFLAKTMASYGKFSESDKIIEEILKIIDEDGANAPVYGLEREKMEASSAATAAVVLEMILARQEEEVYLTSWQGPFEARFTQLRSLDGTFYLKRLKLPEKTGKYSKILIETPNKGAILSEKSFIISCQEPLSLQIQSERGMDISILGTQKTLVFKGAHKVEKLLPARQKMLVQFVSEIK